MTPALSCVRSEILQHVVFAGRLRHIHSPWCRDPEQTWGRLSHSTLERTRIFAKSRKPLTKEICQLTVEDSAADLKQLVSPLRGPERWPRNFGQVDKWNDCYIFPQ